MSSLLERWEFVLLCQSCSAVWPEAQMSMVSCSWPRQQPRYLDGLSLRAGRWGACRNRRARVLRRPGPGTSWLTLEPPTPPRSPSGALGVGPAHSSCSNGTSPWVPLAGEWETKRSSPLMCRVESRKDPRGEGKCQNFSPILQGSKRGLSLEI